MEKFNGKSLCILGRQPSLGLAELESLYGAERIRPLEGAALLDIEPENIAFKRLGGTIKLARVLAELETSQWHELASYLSEKIPGHLQYVPEGKFTLGLSVYGMKVPPQKINATLLELKKKIKATGRPVRIVPNKTGELSSAQVLHNKLTTKGAWELIFIPYGTKNILAQSLFVQDIEAYAARDQARPKRDARVGMLPPKLAQILVNLATGSIFDTQQSAGSTNSISSSAGKQVRAVRLLDPFCGTGVILQEALLMGYSVVGTDIDPRMVEYTKENLAWLVSKYPKLEGHVVAEEGDATNFVWPRFSAVATETYLGRPLSSLPEPAKLHDIVRDVDTITNKFLKNLAGQMKPGQKAAIAVPAWRRGNEFVHLPLIDHLTDMGYNRIDLKLASSTDLIYFREGQVVARQLIILEKA